MKPIEKNVVSIAAPKLASLANVQPRANPRSELQWLLSDRDIAGMLRVHLKEQLERSSRFEFGLQDNALDTAELGIKAEE